MLAVGRFNHEALMQVRWLMQEMRSARADGEQLFDDAGDEVCEGGW